jgi:Short repeat of unknown function (DUF308)
MLGLGLLSIVAGIIVLIEPGSSLKVIAVITGIFVLIDGIVALVAALSRGTENRGLAALIGVLNLVVGVLLIRHPIGGVVAVALLVGIWLIVAGAVRFVLAFDAERHRRQARRHDSRSGSAATSPRIRPAQAESLASVDSPGWIADDVALMIIRSHSSRAVPGALVGFRVGQPERLPRAAGRSATESPPRGATLTLICTRPAGAGARRLRVPR